MRYRIFGMIVEADCELSMAYALPEGTTGGADIRICAANLSWIETQVKQFIEEHGDTNEEGEPLWLVEKLDSQESWGAILGDGYFCMREGKTLEYMRLPQARQWHFEQSLFVYGMSVIMIQRGTVMLHGSCVCYDNRAVILTGESGSGKSTLTDELLKRDMQFMADDAVALRFEGDTVCAQAAFPVRRMCADALTAEERQEQGVIYMPDGGREKYGLPERERYHAGEACLGAIFCLAVSPENEIKVEPVSGGAKLTLLLDCLYKKSTYQQLSLTAKMMSELLKLAGQIPVYRVNRPQNRMTVGELAEEVQKIMQSL